jgi:translocator protein
VRSLSIAFGICALAALLEGVAAGRGVKERLASLRAPRWAFSFGAWVVVGAVYYVLCFAVLLRLLDQPSTRLRSSALVTLLTLMAANAGFNFIFFRRRNLLASFLFFLPYSAIAVALFVQLLLADRLAAAIFGPYLLYFVYATAWGYQMWRLNADADSGA